MLYRRVAFINWLVIVMPKLRQTDEQKQNTYLIANIKRGMDIWGVSKEQLAKRTDISLATLYNRFNDPAAFHLYELRRIAQSLHTTVEDLMRVS